MARRTTPVTGQSLVQIFGELFGLGISLASGWLARSIVYLGDGVLADDVHCVCCWALRLPTEVLADPVRPTVHPHLTFLTVFLFVSPSSSSVDFFCRLLLLTES